MKAIGDDRGISVIKEQLRLSRKAITLLRRSPRRRELMMRNISNSAQSLRCLNRDNGATSATGSDEGNC